MPDARKTLSELRAEWSTCKACELGQRREMVGGEFVFGEGTRRGIMFVGEGPGKEEEQVGRPFIGKSGEIIRAVIRALHIQEFYITNVVTCRSCEPVLDENGFPRLQGRGRGPKLPVYRDIAPSPINSRTCRPRLMEEIYLVDPIIIVSLGGTATEVLTGEHITITRDRGQVRQIEVPGAGVTAVLTEKKHAWFRKVHGEIVSPVEQSMVRYLLVPTYHPSFVARELSDKGPNSPMQLLVRDVRHAVKVYETYLEEVYGERPTGGSDATFEQVWGEYTSDGENDG